MQFKINLMFIVDTRRPAVNSNVIKNIICLITFKRGWDIYRYYFASVI